MEGLSKSVWRHIWLTPYFNFSCSVFIILVDVRNWWRNNLFLCRIGSSCWFKKQDWCKISSWIEEKKRFDLSILLKYDFWDYVTYVQRISSCPPGPPPTHRLIYLCLSLLGLCLHALGIHVLSLLGLHLLGLHLLGLHLLSLHPPSSCSSQTCLLVVVLLVLGCPALDRFGLRYLEIGLFIIGVLWIGLFGDIGSIILDSRIDNYCYII